MNLTDNDRADLARFLVDRYPLSPRVRHYRDRGSVRSIKDPRRGQFDLWEIAV